MGFEMYLIEPLADACGLESIKTSPPPESALRQFVVAWSVLTIGAYLFYFFFSGLNYYIIHRKFGNLKHAPFHGQVCAEIMMASKGILVSLWFLLVSFVKSLLIVFLTLFCYPSQTYSLPPSLINIALL